MLACMIYCVSHPLWNLSYVAVPQKQLSQDFSTKMLLKFRLGFRLMLTMAPNIPQCTVKMIVIQTGPPFHFYGAITVKNGTDQAKKLSGQD